MQYVGGHTRHTKTCTTEYLFAQYVKPRIKIKSKHMSKERHTASMSYYGKKTFNHISLVYVSIYCESKTEKKKDIQTG